MFCIIVPEEEKRRVMFMSCTTELRDMMIAYRKLSFGDRAAFYSTISNDICITDGQMQSFLIETRITDDHGCIYCGGTHVVKNGTRKDGTQRFLCRDCRRSFLPTSVSVISRTRKRLSVWASYLNCMLDKKTLKETAEECGISMATSFSWRHKILDALHELSDKVYLDGEVEADETFFDVSYKGNHKDFSLPREPHKRGHSVHTRGLSSEKVCVPCAVDEAGISFARPAKLGKVSSECEKKISLIQTGTDSRLTEKDGRVHGIQRVNAYHSRLKGFLQRFHGVSTKYLGNYIVWNDIMENSFTENDQEKREELYSLLLAQFLTVKKTVYNRDIPARPAVPSAV